MDEEILLLVEIIDHLDENQRLLDQMECLFDVMWVEELYNKHHDDEQQLEEVDLDEMMKIEYRLVLMVYFDLVMEDLYYHLLINDQLHLHIDEYFFVEKH